MKTENRLTAYALSATAFLCVSSAASGQIIYTDLVPDDIIEDLDSSPAFTVAEYDLDGDGQNDIAFEATYRYWGTASWGGSEMGLLLRPAGPAGGILGTSYALPLCSGDYIGSAAYFNPVKNQIASTNSYWSTTCMTSGSGSSSRTTGGSFGVPAYLGFSFEISGNTHYGWVRYVVNTGSSLTLDAFAYQATPGAQIYAGQEPNDITVSVADITNLGTSADFEVTFAGLEDESLLSEYRVMIVPESDVSSFDLTAAQACSNFESFSPSGSMFYTNTLSPTLLDVNGNAIVNDVDNYSIVVLAHSPSGTDLLGKFSPLFKPTLYVDLPEINVVKSVPRAAITATMQDVSVSFAMSVFTDIAELRMIMVPTWTTIDVTGAAALPADRYKVIPVPSGPGTVTTDLSGLAKDSEGNAFQHNSHYTPQILAIAASGTAAINSITESAQHVQVWLKPKQSSSLELTDVDETGTAADAKVKFRGYENATCISEYRAFVVPESSGFSKTAALSKPASHYASFPIAMTGSLGDEKTYQTTLPASTLDYEGNTIEQGVQYDLVVLAVGNGQVEHTYTRSYWPSVLSINLSPPSAISIVNSYDSADLSDIWTSFVRADDEDHIGAYRVMCFPAGYAVSDVAILAAAPDQYVEIIPTGASHSLTLPVGMRDIFGSPIEVNQPYKVAVASVYNGPAAIVETVISADAFELVDILDPMEAVEVTEVGNVGNGSDVSISFTVPDESTIDEYRIFASRQDIPWSGPFSFWLAKALTYNCYTFGPTGATPGSTHTVSLSSSDRSRSGDYIGNGIPYKFYIFSSGTAFSLSQPSEVVMLTDPDMEITPDRIETNAALQQRFYFDAALKHDEVYRYLAYLRKADSPLDITPWSLANLPAESLIHPDELTGGEWEANLQSCSEDIDGNPILEGESYEVVVLTQGYNSPDKSNGFTVVETGMYFDFRTAGTTGIDAAAPETLNVSLAGEMLFIDLPENISEFNIELFNVGGQLVHSVNELSDRQLYLPDLSSGIYQLRLSTGSKRYRAKFFKP